MNSPSSEEPRLETVSYLEIITSIVKRFARLAGFPAALNIARKIPGLSVDDDGNILDFNSHDPSSTITLLIDQYEVLYGEIARTLVRQAAQPLVAVTDHKLLQEIGLSDEILDPVRLLLVDDHVLLREGLVSVLGSRPEMKVVGQASSLQEAIALIRTLSPHLVLMNMILPDSVGGDAIRAIRAEAPESKIVVLTGQEDEALLFDAIRAGAIGYLSSRAHTVELLETLRGVIRGEAGISGSTARQILDEFVRLSDSSSGDETLPLTAREVEVLRELAKGASNQKIAQRLGISENTVKNHVRNVLVKLHLHSRREAAEYVRRYGLISRRSPP